MDALKYLVASSLAFVPLTGVLAGDRAAAKDSDLTSAAVAALKASVGKAADVDVEEVRVTDAGIACIDYRVSDKQGVVSRAHAVVRGNEVLQSTSGNERFEEMWSDHCLGPRGGAPGSE